MWETVKTTVLLPTLGRAGTGVTGYLVGMGANAQHADWVGTGLVGAVLIGLDLVASWAMRQMADRKAEQHLERVRASMPAHVRPYGAMDE